MRVMTIAVAVALAACTPKPEANEAAPSAPTATPAPKAKGKLNITSYGGAYSMSQRKAFFEPFTKETGTQIIEDDYNGELAKIKAMVQTKSVSWDLVDVESDMVLRGCDEGILEPIDPKILGDTKDFLPGAVHECGVASVVWSTAFAYDAKRTPNGPKTLEDVFDVERFPGKRALRKNPKSTLAQALMATGVPADQVYSTLATKEGVDRALAKLDTIKKHIVWWEAGAQPPQLLADGEVVIAQAYNGRIYNAQVKEKKPFVMLWDGQVYDYDYWVVPKGAPNRALAMEFITYAMTPARMAIQTQYIAYAPTRPSAMPLVDPATIPHLPTSPANFKRALRIDSAWWADHFDDINARFQAWLAH